MVNAQRKKILTDLQYESIFLALAGIAQLIECRPANQRVAGSIPSQGTCLGCEPGAQ